MENLFTVWSSTKRGRQQVDSHRHGSPAKILKKSKFQKNLSRVRRAVGENVSGVLLTQGLYIFEGRSLANV